MPNRLVPIVARSPDESGRVASSLELFFDLVFVVAVSVAGASLHHALAHGEVVHGVVNYLVAFFGIWWAWMNFTWFATSFDNDDWLYRVHTIVQMAGVLVLAAGIRDAFEEQDFTIIVAGYVVMRMAMVSQWLRAGRGAPQYAGTAHRYAGGIAAMQVAWVLFLLADGSLHALLLPLLVAGELAVPMWAERAQTTPWHPHHITERYGLFTLILLGESLLGSANAIIDALHEHDHVPELLALAVLALATTASLWWIYFWPPHHERIGTLRQSLTYGYGHYVLLAAAGALSAGIEVAIDHVTGDTSLGATAATFTYSVPIALFLVMTWVLSIRPVAPRAVNVALSVGAALVLLDPLIPIPVALTSVILAGVVVVLVREPAHRAESRSPAGDRPLDVAGGRS